MLHNGGSKKHWCNKSKEHSRTEQNTFSSSLHKMICAGGSAARLYQALFGANNCLLKKELLIRFRAKCVHRWVCVHVEQYFI
jgi:hypothetical protein